MSWLDAHIIPSFFLKNIQCTLCTFDFTKTISDYHSYQMAHQKKGWQTELQLMRKTGEREQGGKKKTHKNGNHSLVTKRLPAEAFVRQCHAYNYGCMV